MPASPAHSYREHYASPASLNAPNRESDSVVALDALCPLHTNY